MATAGTDAVLYLHDGSSYVDVSQYIRTTGLNRARDMYDITTLGMNDRAFVGGLRNNTHTLEGPFDPTMDAFLAARLDDTSKAFRYYPAGEAGGGGADSTHPLYSGSYLISSYDTTTPVDNVAGFTANIQFTGTISRAVSGP